MRVMVFKQWVFYCWLWMGLLFFASCEPSVEKSPDIQAVSPYLNHGDSAYYTGKESCRDCHYQNYLTFHQTGMGKSFGKANPKKSAAVIGPDSVIYDRYKNLWYQPYWDDSVLMVMEFRLKGRDTVHQRNEKVHYIVGSGHHTNSHISVINGYAHQIPFTYYTQDQRFDFPPGFEGENNVRFSRYLSLECISCHNGLPSLVLGSQNKYTHIPEGIDCERCHGPGSIHVNRTKKSILVDTSKMIDYTIVNPARLPKNLQNDICARCHLQGTMVLKNGKSFYDYKPGMALTDIMDVFMPDYSGGMPTLIMASHYERMTISKCYLSSNGDISCIQCHNPHISVEQTDPKVYNKVCSDCHSDALALHQAATRAMPDIENCVTCHMIKRGSRDIPHVKITDHKISLPDPEVPEPMVFKGLAAVNNRKTDMFTKGRGYLREYETYFANPVYLDSAYAMLLPTVKKTDKAHFKAFVQYFFLTKDYKAIRSLEANNKTNRVLNEWLLLQDYENDDAWAAYRIGQAFEADGYLKEAWQYYNKAVHLAPYMLEMQNKYGSLLVSLDSIAQARRVFAKVLAEYPRNERAWVNLGFCEMKMNNATSARKSFEMALSLNPDNVQARINLAGLLFAEGAHDAALLMIDEALRLDPSNAAARELRARM